MHLDVCMLMRCMMVQEEDDKKRSKHNGSKGHTGAERKYAASSLMKKVSPVQQICTPAARCF